MTVGDLVEHKYCVAGYDSSGSCIFSQGEVSIETALNLFSLLIHVAAYSSVRFMGETDWKLICEANGECARWIYPINYCFSEFIREGKLDSWTKDETENTLGLEFYERENKLIAGKRFFTEELIIPQRINGALLTCIEDAAFFGQSTLKSVLIPNGVLEIRQQAFLNCDKLTTVFVPKSVDKINKFAFNGCQSLLNIRVDYANSKFCSVDGVLYSKNRKKLIYCPAGIKGQFAISQSVNEIADISFSDCSYIQSVTIPTGVKKIVKNAFFNVSHIYYSGACSEN